MVEELIHILKGQSTSKRSILKAA